MAAEYGGTGGASTEFLTTDGLGSVRLVTGVSGEVRQRRDFAPFGEELAGGDRSTGPPCEPRMKFTGKERDCETGLDYFGARYLWAGQGRWTSPDAPFADQHVEDGQSWNLYSYVRNRPLAHIDEDGRETRRTLDATIRALPDAPPTERVSAVVIGALKGFARGMVDVGRGMGMPESNARSFEHSLMYTNAREKLAGDLVSFGQTITGGKSLAVAGMMMMKNPLLVGQAFKSFDAFKAAMGSAGENSAWHHIVEQSKVGEFPAEAIHNTVNLVKVSKDVNQKINAYYSSKQDFTAGKTVRDWLKGKSWSEQYKFGLETLRRVKKGQL